MKPLLERFDPDRILRQGIVLFNAPFSWRADEIERLVVHLEKGEVSDGR
jgi:hypothetical protein